MTDTTLGNVCSAASWLGSLSVALVITLASPVKVLAQEHEPQEAATEQHEVSGEQHESAEGHGEEHLHKHHFAVFVGSTEPESHHGDGHGESEGGGSDDRDFTLGFDYERRLSKLWGFGGMFDWVVEGRREYLIGPIGFLHAWRGLRLYAAPCYQHIREGDDDNFVFRVGGTWDFEVGKYTIGPHIIYDFADGQDFLVFGVGFGWGF